MSCVLVPKRHYQVGMIRVPVIAVAMRGEAKAMVKANPEIVGPQFRTGGRERPLRKNEVYISPDRKEAMIEAGVWDDPVLRNKYLKSYSDYDKQASAEGA